MSSNNSLAFSSLWLGACTPACFANHGRLIMGNLSGKEGDEDHGGSFEAHTNRTNASAPEGPLFHGANAEHVTPVDMGTPDVATGAAGGAGGYG